MDTSIPTSLILLSLTTFIAFRVGLHIGWKEGRSTGFEAGWDASLGGGFAKGHRAGYYVGRAEADQPNSTQLNPTPTPSDPSYPLTCQNCHSAFDYNGSCPQCRHVTPEGHPDTQKSTPHKTYSQTRPSPETQTLEQSEENLPPLQSAISASDLRIWCEKQGIPAPTPIKTDPQIIVFDDPRGDEPIGDDYPETKEDSKLRERYRDMDA